MYRIKVLRTRGIRKHDRQIQSDPGIAGCLTLALVGGTHELTLHAANDGSTREPLIPILYDARVVAMHSDKMLFRGIERTDGAGYEQEWSVAILST